jgi:hypothetical protein
MTGKDSGQGVGILFEHLDTVSLSYKKVLIKGGGDEKNHYIGNGFSDVACIYWRMLAMVG